MKNNKNNNKKKALGFAVPILLSLILILSNISIAKNDERGPAAYIVQGSAVYCNGGNADGATVTLTPSSGTTVNTIVGPSPSGFWQKNVGSMGGPGWEYGVTFTVDITISGWSGSAGPFTVLDDDNYLTLVGEVVLNPTAAVVATASGNPTTIVAGETVDFTGSAVGGTGVYTWDWDFDGGASGSTQQSPQDVVFSSVGTYVCTLTVDDDCTGTDTDTVTIQVNNELSADAHGPYTGTTCNPVSFSGDGVDGHPPYTDYLWDFGDGDTSTLQNPSHQYDTDDTYTVTLTVTDDNSDTAVDSTTATISTSALVAEAGGPYEGSAGVSVQFDGSASGGCSPYSYSWDFGDGVGTSIQENPSYAYSSDGDYTATLTVTDDNSVIDVDTASVTISTTLLVADAHGPYTGTAGVPIEFEGSAYGGKTPYSFHWDFGDGETSDEQNPSHAYTTEGEYTAILTVTDDNSDTDGDTAAVIVYGGDLNADANGPYFGTPGENIQFEGNAYGGTPPYSFEWNFGDGIGSSTEQNPTYAYADEGVYTVVLSVTGDEGLTDSDDTTATISVGNANLDCSGSLSWTDVKPGGTVTDSFTVENIGASGTMLDWEITEYPTWGTWTFTPSSGDDLTPEAGSVTVSVSVVAPDEKDESFSGAVKIVNKEDSSDYCTVMVSLVTPKVRVFNIVDWFMEFLENSSKMFPILRQLIGLLD